MLWATGPTRTWYVAKDDPRQVDFLLEEDRKMRELADRMLKKLQAKKSTKKPK